MAIPAALRADVSPSVGRSAYVSLDAAARAALEDAASAADWPAPDRVQALGALDRVVDLVTAARGRLLRAERDAGTWDGRGDRDLVGWRGRTSRAGVSDAAAQVREAETLEAMPRVEEALTSGRLPAGHLAVLARAAARATAEVGAAMRSPSGQVELVELAERRDSRAYARAVDRWLSEQSPADRQRTHDQQRADRFLHLSDAPSGTHIKGLLDSVAGRVLRIALESAAGGPPSKDDPRSSEQRRADALATLAESLLAAREEAPGAVARPHISVILREETWTALRLARETRCAGDGPSSEPGGGLGTGDAVSTGDRGGNGGGFRTGLAGTLEALAGVPAPADDDGGTIPASAVLSILCDCELTRVVVDADGTPVDLGRAQRRHSPAQRRAIIHRDGGCVWPACTMPARWCQVHHPEWWFRDDGVTSIGNDVLLCSFHHHEVHRRDIRITRHGPADRTSPTAGGLVRYTLTLPNGTVIGDGPPADALGGDASSELPDLDPPGVIVGVGRPCSGGAGPPDDSGDAGPPDPRLGHGRRTGSASTPQRGPAVVEPDPPDPAIEVTPWSA